jgi:hypothetical protein
MALLSSLGDIDTNPKIEFAVTSGQLDFKTIKYCNQHIPLSLITVGYNRILLDTRKLIKSVLGKYAAIDTSQYATYEDGSNRAPFFSFLNDARNSHLFSSSEKLLSYAKKSIIPADSFSNAGGLPKVNQLLKKLSIIQENLLVLVHLDGGLPARSTEIATWRIYNDYRGNLRNVFWYYNTICIFAFYNKTDTVTMKVKQIPRFLSEGLSQVLLHFLLYIRPLLMYLYLM